MIYSLENGGAERVLSTLSNYFIKTNKVTILTFKNGTPYYKLNKNIIVKSINSSNNSNNIFEAIKNNFITIINLTKTIKKINPDVVISFMTTSNILATISCKIINKPIIISERVNYDIIRSKIWKNIRKFIYPFSDYLVVQSNYDLEKYSFVKNTEIIYNPLFFNEPIENKDREKFILAVGRLDKQKGFDILIEAYSKLDTDFKLIIVGEGTERESLENLISRENLSSNVELVGRKSDIIDYYNRTSIFVLSSRFEGFPNALCEAMACGCPSIAFDCKTGPSNIIENGINGILVEPENVEKLSLAMKYLLENVELRNRLSDNAMRITEKLNIENIASQWGEIINKLKFN
ncbi:glycosyltransferase family 4 protein [Sulfurimonas sp.]|nr:glycosyltransferase family 4 protein [Sulfurimonas sp.]